MKPGDLKGLENLSQEEIRYLMQAQNFMSQLAILESIEDETSEIQVQKHQLREKAIAALVNSGTEKEVAAKGIDGMGFTKLKDGEPSYIKTIFGPIEIVKHNGKFWVDIKNVSKITRARIAKYHPENLAVPERITRIESSIKENDEVPPYETMADGPAALAYRMKDLWPDVKSFLETLHLPSPEINYDIVMEVYWQIKRFAERRQKEEQVKPSKHNKGLTDLVAAHLKETESETQLKDLKEKGLDAFIFNNFLVGINVLMRLYDTLAQDPKNHSLLRSPEFMQILSSFALQQSHLEGRLSEGFNDEEKAKTMSQQAKKVSSELQRYAQQTLMDPKEYYQQEVLYRLFYKDDSICIRPHPETGRSQCLINLDYSTHAIDTTSRINASHDSNTTSACPAHHTKIEDGSKSGNSTFLHAASMMIVNFLNENYLPNFKASNTHIMQQQKRWHPDKSNEPARMEDPLKILEQLQKMLMGELERHVQENNLDPKQPESTIGQLEIIKIDGEEFYSAQEFFSRIRALTKKHNPKVFKVKESKAKITQAHAKGCPHKYESVSDGTAASAIALEKLVHKLIESIGQVEFPTTEVDGQPTINHDILLYTLQQMMSYFGKLRVQVNDPGEDNLFELTMLAYEEKYPGFGLAEATRYQHISQYVIKQFMRGITVAIAFYEALAQDPQNHQLISSAEFVNAMAKLTTSNTNIIGFFERILDPNHNWDQENESTRGRFDINPKAVKIRKAKTRPELLIRKIELDQVVQLIENSGPKIFNSPGCAAPYSMVTDPDNLSKTTNLFNLPLRRLFEKLSTHYLPHYTQNNEYRYKKYKQANCQDKSPQPSPQLSQIGESVDLTKSDTEEIKISHVHTLLGEFKVYQIGGRDFLEPAEVFKAIRKLSQKKHPNFKHVKGRKSEIRSATNKGCPYEFQGAEDGTAALAIRLDAFREDIIKIIDNLKFPIGKVDGTPEFDHDILTYTVLQLKEKLLETQISEDQGVELLEMLFAESSEHKYGTPTKEDLLGIDSNIRMQLEIGISVAISIYESLAQDPENHEYINSPKFARDLQLLGFVGTAVVSNFEDGIQEESVLSDKYAFERAINKPDTFKLIEVDGNKKVVAAATSFKKLYKNLERYGDAMLVSPGCPALFSEGIDPETGGKCTLFYEILRRVFIKLEKYYLPHVEQNNQNLRELYNEADAWY